MARKRNVPAVRDEPLLPWEKQKGEPGTAFWAFSVYRDLGPRRSLTKVGEIAGETGVAAASSVERWSSRWKWVERADAWDRDQDRKRTAERDEALASARRSEVIAGSAAMTAIINRLRGRAASEGVPAVQALDPNAIEWGDFNGVANAAMKLLDSGLGEAGADLKGTVLVRVTAFQDFARALADVALAWGEAGMREVYARNGELSPEALDALILRRRDLFIEDGEALFRKALR